MLPSIRHMQGGNCLVPPGWASRGSAFHPACRGCLPCESGQVANQKTVPSGKSCPFKPMIGDLNSVTSSVLGRGPGPLPSGFADTDKSLCDAKKAQSTVEDIASQEF